MGTNNQGKNRKEGKAGPKIRQMECGERPLFFHQKTKKKLVKLVRYRLTSSMGLES